MWKTTREVLTGSLQDLWRSWSALALADLMWKAVAFALLTPGTLLLFRWFVARGEGGVVADADIATVLLTTLPGFTALVVGLAVLAGISALEISCLMAIGFAEAEGKRLHPRQALLFVLSRAHRILALTFHMVVRILVGVVPFAIAGGLVYLAFLRQHDINFYLSRRPPSFWVAAAALMVMGSALAFVLAQTIARWAFALAVVLFENVPPRRAIGESRLRTGGHHAVILPAIGIWGAIALAVAGIANWLPETAGRSLASNLGGSLAGVMTFIVVLALAWGLLGLMAGIFNTSLFSLVLARLYLGVGKPRNPHTPGEADDGTSGGLIQNPRFLATAAAVAVLSLVAAVLFVAAPARKSQPVVVIAHRGSSLVAPENSLSAFRLAVEEKADFVELDVQESADGEILVVHDSDLMKLGGDPRKIWEATAAELRSVDIGSRVGPQFAAERVPTLAEALAVCKGHARVIVELKSYGHAVRLEERVVEIVEAAGMENDCVFMSLNHDMVKKMKQLRPAWRTGVLAAKAIGDITAVGADFVAVESRMVTARFVRNAHRQGQEVYPWTVDDPAWMLTLMSRGVDGLITNRPDVARRAVAVRAEMSDAERVLTALLVRLGARTEVLASEDALRP